MVTKKIEWWSPLLGEQEKELVCQVLDSGFLNEGDVATAFENEVAKVCDVPYAVATTSGTAAIFLALSAVGVKAGDEVIVPNITFIATANAVKLTGATPVLVDVDSETLCMSPAAAKKAITSKTRAIVPVHVSGRSANLSAIFEIAKEHGIAVIEDAAEALGSKSFGRPLGSMGDAGIFSFTANKTITSGQGGMVITKDPKIHRRLRELKDQGRPSRGTGGADVHAVLGYNFKYTNIQAAVGLAQIKSLPWRLEHLKMVYRTYRDHLQGNSKIRLPGYDLEGGESPQWVDAVVEGRDSLHDYLLARGVQTRKFWFPIHTQEPYRLEDSAFPASIEACKKALWLPSAFSLKTADIEWVSSLINEWAKEA